MLIIVVVGVLAGAVWLAADFVESRSASDSDRVQPTPMTPQLRRRYIVVACSLAAVAAALWSLLAVGVVLDGWTRHLAILSSVAALACIYWVADGWRRFPHRDGDGGSEVRTDNVGSHTVGASSPNDRRLDPKPPGL